MVVKKISDRFFLLCCACLFGIFFFSAAAHAAVEDHITRTETGFYYTVQKGDTLWDLSQEFANSPWVWPEIWHYNTDIKNPHLIYPGQKILIYKKEWQGDAAQDPPAAARPLAKTQTFHTYTDIERVGFIRETEVDAAGTIFKVQGDMTLLHTGNRVYIYPDPDGPGLAVGGKYTLYRPVSPVKDEDGINYGVQHFLTGVVEITGVTPEFATARIVNTYRDILINDRLMPYVEREPDIPIRESLAEFEGKIITTEKDEVLVGQFTTVFIDKGTAHGVQPGQFYSVYLQESARPTEEHFTEVPLTPVLIGEIFILHTEKNTSTALVTRSREQFVPGNLVRTLAVGEN